MEQKRLKAEARKQRQEEKERLRELERVAAEEAEAARLEAIANMRYKTPPWADVPSSADTPSSPIERVELESVGITGDSSNIDLTSNSFRVAFLGDTVVKKLIFIYTITSPLLPFSIDFPPFFFDISLSLSLQTSHLFADNPGISHEYLYSFL